MVDVQLLFTGDLWGGEGGGKRLLLAVRQAPGFPSAATQAAGEWAVPVGEAPSTLFGHQNRQKRLKDAR